uniref:Uncharacterized protein n=1 Tax=Plectus sambesii TaxID=2011161 RepID=A0A914VZG5_9BILA
MRLLLLAVCVFAPLASSFKLPEGVASNAVNAGIAPGAFSPANGQSNGFAALFTAFDADKTALKECFESFNVSCVIAIIDEKISNLTDGFIKDKLTAVRDQLTSVVSIFDNLSEDEKKIFKSRDWAAIDTLLQGKFANITDEDQRKKAEGFFAQLKAIRQGRPDFSHSAMGGAGMMEAMNACYKPMIDLWTKMTEEQQNTTKALMEDFKFEEVKAELEKVIATLKPEEQEEPRKWLDENTPPPALRALLANLTEEERAKVADLKSAKSVDFGVITTVMTIFKPHIEALTSDERSSLMGYFLNQAKCMMGSMVRPQGEMSGNGAFPMKNGQMPLVKPVFVGGPSVDVMPVDGRISGGRPHSFLRPAIFPNQASDNLDGSSTLDGVRPLIGKIGVVDNNQEPANADLIRPIAQVGGGRDSARIAARRRRFI